MIQPFEAVLDSVMSRGDLSQTMFDNTMIHEMMDYSIDESKIMSPDFMLSGNRKNDSYKPIGIRKNRMKEKKVHS
jgi:hypothetical protein